jgi:hypothetical protein
VSAGEEGRGRPRPPALGRRIPRWRGRIAFGLLVIAILGAASTLAAARIHRVRVPPPPPLPTATAVDETEWTVRPSRRVLAAGNVRLRVYNRGEDDHDLVLVDGDGVPHKLDLAPGESGTIRARLRPGRYRIYCSLFAGTPDSHEDRGMSAVIRAVRDPARRLARANARARQATRS